MNFSIKDSDVLRQFSLRYENLENRDRLAIKLLLGFIGTVIIIFGMIAPASNYKASSEAHYRNSLETLIWMQGNKPLVDSVSQRRLVRDSGQSLLGIANKTSKGFNLTFKRYQPVGESGLSLWLENESFNNVILWLERLDKRHGISVDEISVDRDEQDGLVSIRLVLQG